MAWQFIGHLYHHDPSASPSVSIHSFDHKITNEHYIDVIMTTIASQITSLTVVYSTVYPNADQRKHQSSASLAFVWGIHRDRWIPRTKGQLRGKCLHLMTSSWSLSPTKWYLILIACFMIRIIVNWNYISLLKTNPWCFAEQKKIHNFFLWKYLKAGMMAMF